MQCHARDARVTVQGDLRACADLRGFDICAPTRPAAGGGADQIAVWRAAIDSLEELGSPGGHRWSSARSGAHDSSVSGWALHRDHSIDASISTGCVGSRSPYRQSQHDCTAPERMSRRSPTLANQFAKPFPVTQPDGAGQPHSHTRQGEQEPRDYQEQAG